MGWGGLTEAQVLDILSTRLGFNKVKLPAASGAGYSAFVAAFASSDGAQTSIAMATASGGKSLDSGAGDFSRAGEKITDTARRRNLIISVTFAMKKSGLPTGTLTVTMRKASDDSIVATATTTLDVSTLTTSYVNKVFTFPANTFTPNEDFYLLAEYAGGDATNKVLVGWDNINPYAGGTIATYNGTYATSGTDDIAGSFLVGSVSQIYDGNTGTKWQSNSEANPYIYGDIGSVKIISGVQIYWGAAGKPTAPFSIQTSEDAITWTTQVTGAATPTSNQYTEYAFNAVVARYVKILFAETIAAQVYEAQYYTKTTDAALTAHGHGVV